MPCVSSLGCMLRVHCGVQLETVLMTVEEWQFDSFKLSEAASGRPLSCLAFFLFTEYDLIKEFNIDHTKFGR
jgi:hypothetical protein